MLDRLTDEWRVRATVLRKHGAEDRIASLWEDAATELEAALTTYLDEALTLVDGAAESGYSSGHLGRLVRQGDIKNVGRPNAPRTRRGDLPLKPGALRSALGNGDVSRTGRSQIARSIVTSHRKEANDG